MISPKTCIFVLVYHLLCCIRIQKHFFNKNYFVIPPMSALSPASCSPFVFLFLFRCLKRANGVASGPDQRAVACPLDGTHSYKIKDSSPKVAAAVISALDYCLLSAGVKSLPRIYLDSWNLWSISLILAEAEEEEDFETDLQQHLVGTECHILVFSLSPGQSVRRVTTDKKKDDGSLWPGIKARMRLT